jgi:hypothetical protein
MTNWPRPVLLWVIALLVVAPLLAVLLGPDRLGLW